MKVRVGDRVRALVDKYANDVAKAGDLGTVTAVGENYSEVRFDKQRFRPDYMREGWKMREHEIELVRNFDADDLKELRHDIELLKSKLERLSKPREKTLSEASYEELAKEMWKRCAEV